MDGSDIWTIAVGVAVVSALLGVWRGTRRFEATQRRRGRWDERGPLRPTDGPFSLSRWNNMGERLEVIGESIPRPVPRDDASPKRQKPRRKERRRRRPSG
jgi:hypothetical protein